MLGGKTIVDTDDTGEEERGLMDSEIGEERYEVLYSFPHSDEAGLLYSK